MKILYFDTETTGTDYQKHEITQFAAIIEVDGEVKEEINLRCQPKNWDVIDPQAIQTTGITIEELKTYQQPEEMLAQIKDLLGAYIPKYTKMPDKFYPAGHNVQFDLEFLNKLFKDHGNDEDRKWGITSYQNWRALDSRVFGNFLTAAGQLPCDNMKLSTICQHYGIEIDAHDALSDIRATRAVIQKMMQNL
jgi:DNA polymerase-3 subunit epsilon